MTTDCKALSSFLSALDYYIVPDLVRLRREVRPRGRGAKEGCTIPTVLFAFSILDLLGFLMRPPPACKEQSEKNIRFACSADARLFPAEYDRISEALVLLFRHGLTHQIFPKASGVSKPANTRLLIFFLDGPVPILNADRFVDDLVEAIQKFKSAAAGQASPLAKQMNDRLRGLQKADEAQLREMRRKRLR